MKMGLSQYKNAMNEVKMDEKQDDVNIFIELNKKRLKIKRRHIRQQFAALSLMIIISASFILLNNSGNDNIEFWINSEAAEPNKITENGVELAMSSQWNQFAYTDSELVISYDFSIRCHGDEIKSITYLLSEEIITRENRHNHHAWFAENRVLFNGNLTKKNEDDLVYEKIKDDEKSYEKRMIGEKIIVDYALQDSNVSIEVAYSNDGYGKYKSQPFELKVQIELDNGVIEEKVLILEPTVIDVNEMASIDVITNLVVSIKK